MCYCKNIHQNLFTYSLLQTGHGVFFELYLASVGANFEVDQSVFEIPKSYNIQDDGRNIHVQDEDNEIMQFAIQQSLLDTGANNVSAVLMWGLCSGSLGKDCAARAERNQCRISFSNTLEDKNNGFQRSNKGGLRVTFSELLCRSDNCCGILSFPISRNWGCIPMEKLHIPQTSICSIRSKYLFSHQTM